jgi:ribosomal-protein-alanine N-acetyltransferase
MIRTASEQDIDSVLEIEKLSFQTQWSLRSFRKALQEIFLVEDEVDAFLIADCRRQKSCLATIKRLAVHPEKRRMGIGKALLEAGLAILMGQGVEKVMLNVESSSYPAFELYAKYGFRVTYSSFRFASILYAVDPKVSNFFTMELQTNKKNTLALRSPLVENPNNNLNGILPPFEIEGRDGGSWDEIQW